MSGESELPVVGDGPEDEVEIEITEEELGGEIPEAAEPEAAPEAETAEAGEPEAGEEAKEDEPKRRRSPDKRIAELTRRAAEAEARAQQNEQRLAEAENLRRQSDLAMMTHYERSLQQQIASAKRTLIEAKSIGDSEAEVEAQQELFRHQQALNNAEAWLSENKAAPAPVAKPAPEAPAAAAAPKLEPRTAEWIQTNAWFQPGTEDFDPEMHEEATLYARRVERRYKSEGRGDEIGGVEYFTEIDRHMRKEFRDAFEHIETPKRGTPAMSKGSDVAPVARTGVPGAPAKTSTTIRLTVDQRRLAHQLAQSGSIRSPSGGRLTPAEGERAYALQLIKQRKA